MSSQYGEHCPTNGWDRLVGLGHPSKFQRVWCLRFVTATTSLNAGQPNFAWYYLAISWAATLYIHFWGLCPLTEFCQMQHSHCVPVLRSAVLAALLHDTRAVCVSQICSVWQGREIGNFRSSFAPHVFGRRPSRWASAHILFFAVSPL